MSIAADKTLLAFAAVCALAGFACAGFSAYEQVEFLIHGPEGTQDFLISAIAALALGFGPSLVAVLLALFIRKTLSRTAFFLLCLPGPLFAALFISIFALDHFAYG